MFNVLNPHLWRPRDVGISRIGALITGARSFQSDTPNSRVTFASFREKCQSGTSISVLLVELDALTRYPKFLNGFFTLPHRAGAIELTPIRIAYEK